MIEIRQATESDIDTIRDIAHRTWPDTFGSILSPPQIEYMLEMMYSQPALLRQMANGHTFLLVIENEIPLGYASYELGYKGEPKTKIHKIYVLPQTQGKGLGKLLINKIGKIASENNQRALSLNVNRYNAALKFYEHIGFEIAGREDIDIGNGFLMEDYILEKTISSPV